MLSNLAAHRSSPSEAKRNPLGAAGGLAGPPSPDSVAVRRPRTPTPARAPRPEAAPQAAAPPPDGSRLVLPSGGGPVAMVATRSTRAALPPLRLGKHRPLPTPALTAHGLAPWISVLVGAQASYAFARAHVCGAFGKVHFALRLDGRGGPMVVKAIRQREKEGASRLTGGDKTFPASVEESGREFVIHQLLRREFDAHGPRLHELLLPGGRTTFRRLVPYQVPSAVTEFVNDHRHVTKRGLHVPKTYIVSTCELGDAGMLYRTLWRRGDETNTRELRRFVARSLAYQAFVELHVLHEVVGAAHLDIKLGNMHVNPGGAFRLADLGFAQPLDEKGSLNLRGLRGTVAAPEMFRPTDLGHLADRPPRLHRNADIWTVWMAALQLLVPPEVESPFLRVRLDRRRRNVIEDDNLCLAEMVAFLRGAEDLTLWEDGVPRLARTPQGGGRWPTTGNEVVDQFFAHAAAADVQLVELALQHGLRHVPRSRSGLCAQAQRVGELLHTTPQQAVQQWHELLEDLAGEPVRLQAYAHLTRYVDVIARTPALASLFGLPAAPPASVKENSLLRPPMPALPTGQLRRGPKVVGVDPLLAYATGSLLALPAVRAPGAGAA